MYIHETRTQGSEIHNNRVKETNLLLSLNVLHLLLAFGLTLIALLHGRVSTVREGEEIGTDDELDSNKTMKRNGPGRDK